MKKTSAELWGDLECLETEIHAARLREIGPALDQIVALMTQWSISLEEVDVFRLHRFEEDSGNASPGDTGDPELAAFLTHAIEQVLTADPTPPPCPHCTSRNTRLLQRASNRRMVPEFVCDACTRHFTRTLGTPLQHLPKKHMLFDFARCLSQHRSLDSIAVEMRMTRVTVASWVRRFQAWLLMLDPSGHYAERIPLALRAALPAHRCPHCKRTVKASRQGF